MATSKMPIIGQIVQVNIAQFSNTEKNPAWRPMMVVFIDKEGVGGHLYLIPSDIGGLMEPEKMMWCQALQLQKLGECSAFVFAPEEGNLQSHWRWPE